jgi:hypothetical protein
VTSGPLHGTLTGDAPNLTYTPAANYNGTDSFTFNATDGYLDSTAVVSITVTAVNDPPAAAGQPVTTNEDTVVAVSLSASDVENDPLTYTVVTGPQHGTLAGAAPNLTYTPDANYSGSDSFTFTASDGQDTSDPAAVTITVNAVNDPPVCSPISQAADEDTSVTFSPSCTDIDSAALSYQIVQPAQHGTASVSGGMLVYVPNANVSGGDSFSYRASDGSAWSNPAVVAITINPLNDLPVAVNDSAATMQGMPVTISVLSNDSDVDGDALAVTGNTYLHLAA